MIQNRSFVPMNPDKREIIELEHSPFDFVANEGDIRLYAAGLIPSHWHRELEVFLLLKGKIHIGIGSETYEILPGEGCFINTEILHSFTGLVPSPCRYHSFVFDAGIVSGIPGSIFDTRYIRPLLEKGPAFLKFDRIPENQPFFQNFNTAFDASALEPDGYEFQVRSALSQILLFTWQKARQFPSQFPSQRSSTLQDERIKQLLPWIDANLERNLSIKEIAAVINVCPRVCQRLFRQYFHCTPMEYLQEKRLLLAAEKLISTDLPVTDIALSCGFSSPSYFTKQFRELIGKTPSGYREERKKS